MAPTWGRLRYPVIDFFKKRVIKMFFQLIILFQIMIKNTIYNLIKNIFFTFININQVNAHKNN